ncbi:phosphate-binding protein [Desulfuromonas versatilis]|uniref:Phosphate-binding protein n=1 Tax=Desulfuromonas versatilis TaxID=2802975 RepID=A0ABM8HP73_9BACT|nr:phosphate ABC transporter substrate-binding protein [Desulfuromonas versatilis]BCR03403.1 phosphate-binding protein [Desulfuromonas versatilis]
MLVRWIAGLCLGLALAGATVHAAGPTRLRYAGATTLKRDFMPKAAWAFEARTGVGFTIVGGNTDPGLLALRAGEADVAGAGRFLTPAERAAGLVETLVGWDPLAVVVHETNPLEALSLQQLVGIFSGRIARWSEVGGPDLPILLVVNPEGSGMRAAVEEEVLRGESLGPFQLTTGLVEDGDLQVSQFPLAITILSSSMVDGPRVKILKIDGQSLGSATVTQGKYPLVKPLQLVTLGPPRGTLLDFIEFVQSPEGQAIMERRFYGIGTPSAAADHP